MAELRRRGLLPLAGWAHRASAVSSCWPGEDLLRRCGLVASETVKKTRMASDGAVCSLNRMNDKCMGHAPLELSHNSVCEVTDRTWAGLSVINKRAGQ